MFESVPVRFTRTGGTVNLTGTLSNTALLLDAATGSWNLLGGTIVGGTVAFADGETLLTTTSGGLFNGVTLNSDMTVGNNHDLTIDNGLTLNAVLTIASTGNFTDLNFAPGDQTLGGTGEVVLGGTSSNNRLRVGVGGVMTLTIGGDIEVHGRGSIVQSSVSTVINDGVISSDVSGQTLTISTNGFTNNGTAEAINGALGDSTATVSDPGMIALRLPNDSATDHSEILEQIGVLTVQPERTARVIIDARSGRLAWRGWAVGANREGYYSAERVAESVQKILAEFPPGRAK